MLNNALISAGFASNTAPVIHDAEQHQCGFTPGSVHPVRPLNMFEIGRLHIKLSAVITVFSLKSYPSIGIAPFSAQEYPTIGAGAGDHGSREGQQNVVSKIVYGSGVIGTSSANMGTRLSETMTT